MKRIFVLITVIIVILSLSACDLNPIVNKLNGNEAAAKAQQEKEAEQRMFSDHRAFLPDHRDSPHSYLVRKLL